MKKMYLCIKRGMDFIVAIIGLLVLLPLFLVLGLIIKLDSPGPILFKQERIGMDKKYFKLLKFRTMKIDAPKDVPTHLLENPEFWITGVGKFLRKTSLDEIPQLINVVLGQMSFIGPRPALWNQQDLIEEREKYGANDIRPGITGLAQINGRDKLTIEEKAALDGRYTKKIGIIMDTKCLFRTVTSVMKSEGVIEGSNAFEETL